jgi:tetraacyldisaccharide 4'-kinase
VIGFCGIGYPSKFKKTLLSCGFDIVDFVVFGDHHSYTITEIQRLIKAAKESGAQLVTTKKDFVKIPEVFAEHVKVINIELQPDSDDFEKAVIGAVSSCSS